MSSRLAVGALLVLAAFEADADATSLGCSTAQEAWVSSHPHPVMWGQQVAVVPDLDGDRVDDIVCRGPDTRFARRPRVSVSATFRMYRGASDDMLGELRDLPFVSGTERFPTTIRDDPERPLLVAVGIAPTEPPRLRIALIDVVTMSLHAVVTGSSPLETELAVVRGCTIECAAAPGRDASTSLFVACENPGGRLQLATASVKRGVVTIDAEVASDVEPHRGLAALCRVADVDGDGTIDYALAWVPVPDLDSHAGEAANTDVSAGRIDIVSGRTAATVRRIDAPPGAGCFGDALWYCDGADGGGARLYIGAPGWVGVIDGREVVRRGAIYLAEFPDLGVRRLVGVDELVGPGPNAVERGDGGTVADSVGAVLAGLVHDGELFLAIGSPMEDLIGAVHCVDATGTLRWTARGGPDGRFDMMSDFRFGAAVMAAQSGRPPFFLVNARWPSSEGGRIVLFDARNGELVRTLAP